MGGEESGRGTEEEEEEEGTREIFAPKVENRQNRPSWRSLFIRRAFNTPLLPLSLSQLPGSAMLPSRSLLRYMCVQARARAGFVFRSGECIIHDRGTL